MTDHPPRPYDPAKHGHCPPAPPAPPAPTQWIAEVRRLKERERELMAELLVQAEKQHEIVAENQRLRRIMGRFAPPEVWAEFTEIVEGEAPRVQDEIGGEA